MLHISCPSCGERGKIPAHLVGAKIKCKKCGAAFQVPGADKVPAAVGAGAAAAAASASAPTQTYDGIAVDGLDPAAWTLAPDQSSIVPAAEHHEPAHAAAVAPAPSSGGTREYKLLTSRDKIFEGKFDLTRLEDAINHYARQGWTAKSMCLPHIKNFQGSMQEELIVLLER
ncbi:DUF4177 domain-containing protein [Paludisphaera rhizosphaerae]|uniref:DUF4177 domain-containing protein n=1 Tax=Paludisphaera rhizosphaerae TaxID=2711216 RepID=UPI0013E9D2A1|nr:DUF4177 domain-containing protein [Paludisphaera rhizosphaerae]